MNSDYINTIWFDDVNAQTDYFKGLTKHRLTNQTYQRIATGFMRVEIKIEDLYDCNYIMFQNESFGGKWFYAFITSVEYVNNITTEIGFELDVMQSWFFDYEMLPSFVNREHSATDTIGENTVPETLETGEYITTNSVFLTAGDLYTYVVVTEYIPVQAIPEDFVIKPGQLGGLPFPCYVFKLGNVLEFTPIFIERITTTYDEAGKGDAIVALFTAPGNFISTKSDVRTNTIYGAERKLSKTPKNNKLYTYPYCANALLCGGQSAVLRYELFENGTPVFQSNSGFGANLKVSVTPLNYGGNAFDVEHTLSLTGFPLLPWTKDYFQNWIAQNKASLIYGTVKDITTLYSGSLSSALLSGSTQSKVSGLTLNAQTEMSNAADNIISRAINVYEHSIIPDSMIGSADSTDSLAVANKLGIYNYCRSIKPEYIDIIDGYFDMFGYATHQVKIPNRNVRPHWCYTQTENCSIKGKMPQEYINRICNIYNRGITFWKNGNEIGDYLLDNRV